MSENPSVNRIRLTKFKLNSLLDITLAINENLPKDELLNRYDKILREDLNIGKIIILKLDEKWNCILNSGYRPATIKRIDVEKHLRQFDEISFITTDKGPVFEEIDIVIPVTNNNKTLAYVLIGDIDEEGEGVSPVIKHLNFIQTISNIIIVAIENIRLNEQNLKQAAMKRELELAAKMQEMLVPQSSSLPKTNKLFASAFYHPHLEVGGDYYDFIKLNENEYGFCISDVSGKGISAALLMSNFQANLRALFNPEISLSELTRKLNDRVIASTNGDRFLTMFLAKYNMVTRELNYVNAGHNPPLLFDVLENKMDFLPSNCVGIGMVDEIPVIKPQSLIINGRKKLFCYTDGLTEMLDENEVETGTEMIEVSLSNDKRIDENITEIIANYKILEGSAAIFDDISIIGIDFNIES
jgi:phosphoserine phosphatase RsbU/P